jgi:hypothetical protein
MARPGLEPGTPSVGALGLSNCYESPAKRQKGPGADGRVEFPGVCGIYPRLWALGRGSMPNGDAPIASATRPQTSGLLIRDARASGATENAADRPEPSRWPGNGGTPRRRALAGPAGTAPAGAPDRREGSMATSDKAGACRWSRSSAGGRHEHGLQQACRRTDAMSTHGLADCAPPEGCSR